MKIGIIGGTFDPIHMGHLLIAEQAREVGKLDQVWFIPSSSPPHKQHKQITPFQHRLQMVSLAIADHPAFQLSDIEMHLSSPSYTVQTLTALKEAYPNHQFYIIVGTDMVKDLPSWYKIEEILQLSQVIGVSRPDVTLTHLPEWIQKRLIYIADGIEIRLSSSVIRERVAKRMSIRYLVPPGVDQYIKENRLYES